MRKVLQYLLESVASIFDEPLHLLAAIVVLTLALDTIHDNSTAELTVNRPLARVLCVANFQRAFEPEWVASEMEWISTLCETIIKDIEEGALQ